MIHNVFNYKTLDDIRETAKTIGVQIPLSEDVSILSTPLIVCGKAVRNRIAIQPMEGCDGTEDGTPDELTVRRYTRFASGGAGMIWFEAVAILPEARANPRQLMLSEKNLDVYKRLVNHIREISFQYNGFEPLIILQATHSGRYSKPYGKPEPLIACHNPVYEKNGVLDEACVVSDEYLDTLSEHYARTARLSEAAGFDGVDIKACHRYLINELLSARTRVRSRYGGGFEERIKLFCDAVCAVRAVLSKNMTVTTRLNVYDGIEYPYGFGVSQESGLTPELSEPIALVKKLCALGVGLINITMGNPYFNPHVNRPFDKGPYVPSEHPFEGLERLYNCVKVIKDTCGDMTFVGSGLSYSRQFSANIASGLLRESYADMAGFGREAFAYPEFPRDILSGNGMEKNKCCIACGKCSELMRAGSVTGCAVRDEVYTDIYRRL